MDPEKEKLMGDDATTGNTKREPAKPMLKLLEYLPNPVTGPALGTIVESEAHRNHLVLLPWVSSMWFVLGLFLLVGQLFALYLYYEYRPAEAGATTKCIKPLHDLCLGLAILGLAMWPIAIFNRLPVVRQAFCGRGWLYPVQIVHCLALVAWLGFGIPWLMAIDSSKVHPGDTLDPLVEPSACPFELYWFVFLSYVAVPALFVVGICCFCVNAQMGTCPRTIGIFKSKGEGLGARPEEEEA